MKMLRHKPGYANKFSYALVMAFLHTLIILYINRLFLRHIKELLIPAVLLVPAAEAGNFADLWPG